MTTISVVVPVYNRRDAARAAIASVRAQTRPAHEIILVDDASAEPFVESDFLGAAPPLHILRLPTNVGAAAARQAGVNAATGEAIAFLDSDDMWAPEKLAVQASLLTSQAEPLAVVSGWRRVLRDGRDGGVRIPAPSDALEDFAAGCWFCPGSTLLIRKSDLERVGAFDPDIRRLEDYEWFLRFAQKRGRLVVAAQPLADIAVGGRAASAAVAHAAERIIARHGGALHERARANMAAYLDLERAAAARNDGRFGSVARHLARSWLAAPRLQAPLKPWWRTR